jgi:hypothetical protein
VIAKRRLAILLLILSALSALAFFALAYLPIGLLPMEQKPTPQPLYDYYEIVDERNNESLMAVPLIVNVGDELLTEDNRRFKVVKVVENIAYARPMKK